MVTGGQGCVEVAGVYTAPIALIGSEVETPLIKTGGVQSMSALQDVTVAKCTSVQAVRCERQGTSSATARRVGTMDNIHNM